MTSSLPWKCSTNWAMQAELIERETRLEPATLSLEGWCSTNWATPAIYCGPRWIWTTVDLRQQIYSLPPLTTRPSTQIFLRAIGGIRTPDPLITNQLLWPTELQWLCLYKKALLSIASQFNILLFNKTTIDFTFFKKVVIIWLICTFYYFFYQFLIR